MQKTTFKIAKMDCPSEEQMIRMKLSDISDIESMQFDIPGHILDVYHSCNGEEIFKKLDSLNFDTSIVSTNHVDHFVTNDNHRKERTLLWQVLVINFFFFGLELLIGFLANSMGLVADGLDMFADSIVYGLALFAVGGTLARKKCIVKTSGYLQLLLSVLGFVEVIRRFSVYEQIPNFELMILISIFALIGNALCLYLLQKSKSNEAHMKASMIFTSNDVIVNLGVIIAGGLVYVATSKIPDLGIGMIVFFIEARGAFRILKLTK